MNRYWKKISETEKRRTLKEHGVTDDVVEVILKAISVDPADRYSSAKSMQDALTELPMKNNKPNRKVKRLTAALLIAATLAGLVGLSMIFAGVYQLDVENGTKMEMSVQDGTQVSDELTLPSAPSGDG